VTESELTIEIKNVHPIELGDFTQSLLSVAEEFRRVSFEDPEVAAADVKLYVTEVRTGSITATLLALAPQALQLLSYANSVLTFYKHVKAAVDYLSGTTADKPNLDKVSLQNIANIVEPIAKDRGSQMNFGHVGQLVINIDYPKANAIQNAARREIALLNEPVSGVHEKVLFYWFQARADTKSKSGDRGIIESITRQPVKTIFANDIIKAQMMMESENPFKEAYIVDVGVETIRERPSLYKIISLHEKFPREDDAATGGPQ
jgi:hypothetical protein